MSYPWQAWVWIRCTELGSSKEEPLIYNLSPKLALGRGNQVYVYKVSSYLYRSECAQPTGLHMPYFSDGSHEEAPVLAAVLSHMPGPPLISFGHR